MMTLKELKTSWKAFSKLASMNGFKVKIPGTYGFMNPVNGNYILMTGLSSATAYTSKQIEDAEIVENENGKSTTS